jgi:uncharacterized protein
VALRTAIVMSAGRGGAQYVSWLHEVDFTRAVEFLMTHDIDRPVNLAAPEPLPQRDFMRVLRAACGVPFGLPVTRWMAELVVPARLLEAGFTFSYPSWPEAARVLVS